MRINHIIIIAASALVIASFDSCSRTKNDGAENKKEITNKAVEVIRVTKSNPEKTLRLPAELLPFNETGIYARVNGYIKNVLVDRGSLVKKGQLLLEIEAPELEAQLADAYAKKLAAETTYKSSLYTYHRLLQTSATPGAVSPNDLDLGQSKMFSDSSLAEAARSNYQSIKEMRNFLRIESPFNGIITERNISPGALVGPNGKNKDAPMLVLKEEDKLRLTLAIPEAYTGQVVQQKQATFKVKAYPSKEFTSTLARRAGSLTTSIRAEMVEFDVDNSKNILKSGMYAEVTMQFSRPQASYYVPKTAVISSTEKVFVIKCVNGSAHRVSVQKGNDTGNSVEIFGDINEGDLLIAKASDEIREGAKLEVKVK